MRRASIRIASLLLLSVAVAFGADDSLPNASSLDGRPLTRAPRMSYQARGVYPTYMVQNGQQFEGLVTLNVTLDAAGGVQDIGVQVATHPGFVAPAIDAVLDSTFVPARIGSDSVASRFSYSVHFLVSNSGIKVTNYATRVPSKPKNLPAEYDYDTPPFLVGFCDVLYPPELQVEDVKGKATGSFLLDASGRVIAGEVLSATKPEFGAALVAAVSTWRFTPATRKGVPVTTIFVQQQEFGSTTWLRPEDESRIVKKLRQGSADFAGPRELDKPLKPLYRVPPVYPPMLLSARATGEATIDFVINHEGHAVLPKIVSATRPEFGWSAATAVSQWFYARPTRGGKPVDVRVRMPFEFQPPPSAK